MSSTLPSLAVAMEVRHWGLCSGEPSGGSTAATTITFIPGHIPPGSFHVLTEHRGLWNLDHSHLMWDSSKCGTFGLGTAHLPVVQETSQTLLFFNPSHLSQEWNRVRVWQSSLKTPAYSSRNFHRHLTNNPCITLIPSWFVPLGWSELTLHRKREERRVRERALKNIVLLYEHMIFIYINDILL